MARPRANGVDKKDVSTLELYGMPKPSKEMRSVCPYPPSSRPILVHAEDLDESEPRRGIVRLADQHERVQIRIGIPQIRLYPTQVDGSFIAHNVPRQSHCFSANRLWPKALAAKKILLVARHDGCLGAELILW